MNGKIALEEHFALPETLGDSQQYAVAGSWGDLQHKLLDVEFTRAVRDLGLKGALVNGFSERGTAGSVVYYDDPVSRGIPARRTMSEYLRSSVYLTTSGNFRTPTLLAAIAEVGCDRIMFSVDYPFEETPDAASWFDTAGISEDDRQKIGRDNAAALFRLTAAAFVMRDV